MEKAITDTVTVASAAASLRASIIAGAMGAGFDASKAEVLFIARCDGWTIQCVADEQGTKVSYGPETEEVREAIGEIRARANVKCRKEDLAHILGIQGYTAYVLIAQCDAGVAVMFE